jgi:ABC-type uncharacterized transport system substrate-binding protein
MQWMKLSMSSLALSACTTLYADGFHYEMQTETKLLADDAAKLTALDMRWAYTPETAKLLLIDRDVSAEKKDATLKKLGKDILDDLYELGYFTELAIDGQPVMLNKVQDYSLSLASDQSLTLDFKLPLKTPSKVAKQKMTIRLLDPEGVGSLVYSNSEKISFAEPLAKLCKVDTISKETIKLPNGHEPLVPTAHISCQ